jgi:excisionase family DNA binding protein
MNAMKTGMASRPVPTLMTVREAAELFRCSPKTIYRWIAQGHIPESAVLRFSLRTIRLNRREIERLIETNGELRRWASRVA